MNLSTEKILHTLEIENQTEGTVTTVPALSTGTRSVVAISVSSTSPITLA